MNTCKPLQLIVMQRRLADNYATYRLFGRPVPGWPRGMDRNYAARHLREARFWAREAVALRRQLRVVTIERDLWEGKL